MAVDVQFHPTNLGARMQTQPIPVARTMRTLDIRNLTSFMPGKMVPIVAFPLLREDRMTMTRLRLNFEQMETAELLMNAVNVRAMAFLVPFLAFDRFDGMDALNRSYMKTLAAGASAVVPFFTTETAGAHGSNEILKSLGKHARPGQVINAGYTECYNTIWNFRAKNRSPDIVPRSVTAQTLADAFWMHQGFAHIVPDFDQAIIDGEVPLNVTDGSVTLRGTNLTGGYNANRGVVGNFRSHTPATTVLINQAASVNTVTTSNNNTATPATISPYVDLTMILGELAENGVTVSLANIELARRTQAFAALRKQYTGHSDDYIIDLLMNGIHVPDETWKQPILLADRTTIIGMAKRYASDSVDLTASVTNGATFIDLAMTTPQVPTGGIVMVVVEVTPEQLFERQQDPFLAITDQEGLPEFLRDTLDPEKVEVVENQYVDIDHDTPTATFGYAPLNHKWNHNGPGIGGKFFRPEVDGSLDEDRMRIWAVETQNPTLSRDFYLCSNMNTKPFVVTNQDPYECVTRGLVGIEGNTVFGRFLIEATDDYDQVMAEAPIDRIDKV